MGNEHKVIELQPDTVLTGYKELILHDNEIVTFSTNCTSTPDALVMKALSLALPQYLPLS